MDGHGISTPGLPGFGYQGLPWDHFSITTHSSGRKRHHTTCDNPA